MQETAAAIPRTDFEICQLSSHHGVIDHVHQFLPGCEHVPTLVDELLVIIVHPGLTISGVRPASSIASICSRVILFARALAPSAPSPQPMKSWPNDALLIPSGVGRSLGSI